MMAWALPAWAQDETAPTDDFGIAALTPNNITGVSNGAVPRAIDIRAGSDVIYDSNLARANAGGAAARGLVREDARFTPRVSANITLPKGRWVFALNALAGYDFYIRNTQLNRERVYFLGQAGGQFSICDIGSQVGYARRQNDLLDLAIIPGDTRASTVNVQDTVRVGGNLACGRGLLRPNSYVEYRSSSNSTAARQIADVDAVIYGGGLTYTSPKLGSISAFVGRVDFNFPNRGGVLAAVQSFGASQYGLRFDRRLGGRLQLSGQVFYTDVDNIAGLGSRFNGVNWELAATLRTGSRGLLSFNTARRLDPSAAFNLRLGEISLYQLRFDYALSPLLQATLSAQRRTRNFQSDPAFPRLVLLTDDTLSQISAGLVYNYRQRLRLTTSASYVERNASATLYNFRAARVSVGASITL
ncbi:MAG: hypothetical protein A4S16_10905 [Proteobacteria bacterium SG_bin6]|nr:MAG: hypothetical protein A4S16_10905 [Proteobacteria bacterium SG_bin6]